MYMCVGVCVWESKGLCKYFEKIVTLSIYASTFKAVTALPILLDQLNFPQVAMEAFVSFVQFCPKYPTTVNDKLVHVYIGSNVFLNKCNFTITIYQQIICTTNYMDFCFETAPYNDRLPTGYLPTGLATNSMDACNYACIIDACMQTCRQIYIVALLHGVFIVCAGFLEVSCGTFSCWVTTPSRYGYG